MEPIVLNPDLEMVKIVDVYESFIWTDRYDACGDFELYFPMSEELLLYFREDNYLWLDESEHTMIIEDISIDTDTENGAHFTATGRSLESMLERRIIWKYKVYSGNLQDAIRNMLEENIINPTDVNRKIENFIFKPTTDTRITNLTIDAQYFGEDLYSVISDLCSENGIGFKIILTPENKFEFSLYIGEDRSYNQTDLPFVIFSPSMDNIVNSNFYSSVSQYKNVVLVGGEGDKENRKTITVGEAKGFKRRESYVEGHISSSDGNGGTLSSTEVEKMMRETGIIHLIENRKRAAFEGEVETNRPFLFGVDYFIGDIVQLVNEYGIEGAAYISELIISVDNTGIYKYPTFKMLS